MVFAHGSPVEAVPGDFLFQNPDAPSAVHLRVEQGSGRDIMPLYPPAVNLHQPHVEALAAGLGGGNDGFGLLPGGGVIVFARHVDGKRVQAGFLPGNSLYEPGRGPGFLCRCRYGQRQHKRKRHKDCLEHFYAFWVSALSTKCE